MQHSIPIDNMYFIYLLRKHSYETTQSSGNGDIGWERKNTAVLRQYVSPESYAAVSAEIDKMPCIIETLKGCEPLFPRSSILTYRADNWEGKKSTDMEDRINITCIREGREFINFITLN